LACRSFRLVGAIGIRPNGAPPQAARIVIRTGDYITVEPRDVVFGHGVVGFDKQVSVLVPSECFRERIDSILLLHCVVVHSGHHWRGPSNFD
jgi:hypothetical protein